MGAILEGPYLIAFTGSLIAFGKLAEIPPGKPILRRERDELRAAGGVWRPDALV
jgi:hypothetical protein